MNTFWSPTPIIGIRHWPMAVDGVLSGFHGPWQPGWNEAAHIGARSSIIYSVLPPSGDDTTATISVFEDTSPHPVPSSACECGLYAMKPGREGLASGDPFAIGLASLTG